MTCAIASVIVLSLYTAYINRLGWKTYFYRRISLVKMFKKIIHNIALFAVFGSEKTRQQKNLNDLLLLLKKC